MGMKLLSGRMKKFWRYTAVMVNDIVSVISTTELCILKWSKLNFMSCMFYNKKNFTSKIQ